LNFQSRPPTPLIRRLEPSRISNQNEFQSRFHRCRGLIFPCKDLLDYRAKHNIGGTAGLLLASRLAHSRSKPTVLVIEAGQDRSELSYRIPSSRFSLAFTNPELDHGYNTVPQIQLGDRELQYVRGKGLGGSTLNNFMCKSFIW